jgi:hypothetical protein
MLRLSVPARMTELSNRRHIHALKQSIPPALVKRTLHKVRPNARVCPVAPDEMAVWLVIGLGLFCTDALREIWRRLVSFSPKLAVPQRTTLCMARQRIGTRVLIELAKAVLRPLGKPDTAGCFYKGMALRAIDCCNLSLFDSPENRQCFTPPRVPRRKRRGGRRPAPAYPQAKLCCLCEAGTHAMLHWGLKPAHWADSRIAPPLLKKLEENQLLMWDSAFYSPQNLDRVLQAKAHLLGRLSWSIKPQRLQTLADGSYLARLPQGRRNWGPTVRIIEYTLQGLTSTRHKKHRLVTTLLDPVEHPALELAELYHTRWEVELAIDELETHQLQQRVLVSQTPAGVVQEVAGLLIAHWLIRQLMFQASVKAGVAPLRISFLGTLKVLRCRLGEAGTTAAEHRTWWKHVVEEVAADQVIEARRPRSNPRVLKRTTYDFRKKKPSDCAPQPVPVAFRQAFAILR